VKAAAGRRLERQAARLEWEKAYGALGTEGGRQDPPAVVMVEIAWTAAHVEWLRAKVQSLPVEDLVWGLTASTVRQPVAGGGERTVEAKKGARPNTWLVLYQEERDRLTHQCEVAARMGVEERLVRQQERHGALIAEVLSRVIADAELGLSAEQQNSARRVASRHLRLVATGGDMS
jgi:hypothetical protein